MNIIARPHLFETVRFPTRDKSKTLSPMFATFCDFTNIAKFTQNNIPMRIYERRFKVKEIYDFADNYLRLWFPMLKSYVAFDKRINRLASTFTALCRLVLEQSTPDNRSDVLRIVDSIPIITCSGKRYPKVARKITNKSYCASKSLYYHGVKLHLLSS